MMAHETDMTTRRKQTAATAHGKRGQAKGNDRKAANRKPGAGVVETVSFPGFLPSTIQKH